MLALLPANGTAQTTMSGSVVGELRYFPESPAFPGQSDDRFQFSTSLDARVTYDWNGGADRIVVSPFLRFGGNGDGRDHFDLREAYWLHQGDGWSLTAGIDKVFWGVTESRHLVDIINQDDALEDIDGEDKLGQPMVSMSFYGEYDTFSVYVLPWLRDREFLGFGPRLGGPFPIGAAEFESADGKRHIDYALRWSHSVGNLDLGLSYFNGTSREPRLIQTGPVLVPHYDQIAQAGLDLQLTAGDWLWKLEAIRRSGHGPGFWAATAGFEWTIPGIAGTGADLGLIAEYSHDGRDPALAPATIHDDDLFLGARLALNDIGDTSLLAGALIDRETDARVFLVEGQRRMGENWVLSLEGRFFEGGVAPDPISVIRNDDYISISLKRSF
jgi:hypothetical protein